jgi:SAM-dependent methyltransferase
MQHVRSVSDDIVTFWERAATTRWGAYLSSEEGAMLERASDVAGPPRVALEIGVEGGRWSKLLQDRGWNMICTDVDAAALAICAARLPEAACILVDPADTTLPCDRASVGLLLAFEVGPVVQSDWFPGEAARVLAPNGILVCSFYNRLSLRALVYRLLCLFDTHRQRYGDDYYRGGTYGAFRRTLVEQGFEPVEELGLGWSPFARHSNSRLIPLCLRIESLLRLARLPRLSPFVLLVARRRH